MNRLRRPVFFFMILLFVIVPLAGNAQEGNTDSGTTPEGIGGDVAEALGEDRGQTEEEQLEDILSSEENEYDLMTAGNVKLNYSFSYSANSSIQPRQRIIPDTEATTFNLLTDSQHTANHQISFRFGLFNFLTTGMNLPIVTKWNTTRGVGTGDLGDISFSARLDPFVSQPGEVSSTIQGNLSVPTGRSPWEIDDEHELSTGSGGYSLGGGVNFSKTVDPVAAFWSVNANYGLPITGLRQLRGIGTDVSNEEIEDAIDAGEGDILREVRPGPSFSFGGGMAYSLSYDVSLTFSMNYGISLPTELVFENRGSVETSTQVSGTLSMSSGWRLSPEYITNFSVGIGLTENSPDMSFSVSFPILLETPATDLYG